MSNDRNTKVRRHHTHEHHYLSSAAGFPRTAHTYDPGGPDGPGTDVCLAGAFAWPLGRALAEVVARAGHKAAVDVESDVEGGNDSSGVETAARAPRTPCIPLALGVVLMLWVLFAWALVSQVRRQGSDWQDRSVVAISRRIAHDDQRGYSMIQHDHD